MNYIRQLNAFYDWLQQNTLSSSAQLLYHTLLMVNNMAGWTESFKRTNQSLSGIMNVSENTLKNARNELMQKKLIDFRSGKKKGDITAYRILNLYEAKGSKFDTQIDKEVSKVSKFDTKADTQVDTKADTKADTQTADIYKLKPKQKHIDPDHAHEKLNFASVYEQEYGQPIPSRWIEMLQSFVEEGIEDEVISEAIRRTRAANVFHVNYPVRILNGWKAQGVTNMAGVARVDAAFEQIKQSSRGKKELGLNNTGKYVAASEEKDFSRYVDMP